MGTPRFQHPLAAKLRRFRVRVKLELFHCF
jgi:hypothetical protein